MDKFNSRICSLKKELTLNLSGLSLGNKTFKYEAENLGIDNSDYCLIKKCIADNNSSFDPSIKAIFKFTPKFVSLVSRSDYPYLFAKGIKSSQVYDLLSTSTDDNCNYGGD